MKSKIKLPFDRLRPVALLALLRNVVLRMTGNANFPTPPYTMADMTTKGDNLEAAIAQATKGSALDRSMRDDQVAITRSVLEKTADYVRFVAQGDRTVLESCGFDMAKQPEPAPLPDAPRDLVAIVTGRNGELELRWKRSPHAFSYQVWMTDQDPLVNGSWDAIGVTARRSRRIDGLVPYKAYWFCVTAIGSAGDSALSEPIPARAA